MRWPTIRLIAGRELRDLLRDRRWLALLLGIPVLLYPAFGLFGFVFAVSTMEQVSVIGIAGLENLPGPPPPNRGFVPTTELAWLTALPVVGGNSFPAVATAPPIARLRRFTVADPPLIVEGQFVADFSEPSLDRGQLHIVPLAAANRDALAAKQIDVLMVIPPDFRVQLARNQTPMIDVEYRDGDDFSRLAGQRVESILNQYRRALKQARFARTGLPLNFDRMFDVRDPDSRRPRIERTTNELRDALIRFVPFMLVMWALAGAMYPAVDLCAGEKERGTMETLLISPAERSEIVAGKFLAVTALSYGAALWNLIWMGALTVLGGLFLGLEFVRPLGLVGCAICALPLAALFGAVCLALGVYARSTKEGQYYLLPIFLVSLPLVLMSLAPGAELTLANCWIPVTNVCLLIQAVMRPGGTVGWLAIPVAVSLAVCIVLALWWASWQFRRESVLFRDFESGGFFDRFRVGKARALKGDRRAI